MKKILIVGYGVAGKSLAKSLEKNNVQVCGFLDDKLKHKRVLGTLDDANVIIKKFNVSDVYFAIPSVPAHVLRDFINSIENTSVHISVIPRSFSIISKETVNVQDLQDVDILALIGREPVKHDLMECRRFVEGKKIIVTGAAGSIGSKLVKLLAELNPEQIVCVDWWENGIFFLQQDLEEYKNIQYRIADIKNPHIMNRIFKAHKPDVVFHAAAYKHVPLMQHNPLEAFNNNVLGSLNLMRQAIKHKVKNFVYVSTDKAVNPVNVMGACKRLGEMVMETLANSQSITKFNAVRFGNVIQSNGSVMQIFKKQIERGLPLTVTDKDVTRYFMTIEEAAQLIIQSTVLGRSGEIFVLDMGEPIKVIDLANSLIRVTGKPIKIKITGLRPGEKMFEELTYDPQSVGKTANDKIYVIKNEKPFKHLEFMQSIDSLSEETLAYNIKNTELKNILKNFGFALKD